MKAPASIMTVAQLKKLLSKAEPHAVVWASNDRSCFPIQYVVATTAGDPVTARIGGDPKGSPAVILSDHRGYEFGEHNRDEYPAPGDVSRLLGHSS